MLIYLSIFIDVLKLFLDITKLKFIISMNYLWWKDNYRKLFELCESVLKNICYTCPVDIYMRMQSIALYFLAFQATYVKYMCI